MNTEELAEEIEQIIEEMIDDEYTDDWGCCVGEGDLDAVRFQALTYSDSWKYGDGNKWMEKALKECGLPGDAVRWNDQDEFITETFCEKNGFIYHMKVVFCIENKDITFVMLDRSSVEYFLASSNYSEVKTEIEDENFDGDVALDLARRFIEESASAIGKVYQCSLEKDYDRADSIRSEIRDHLREVEKFYGLNKQTIFETNLTEEMVNKVSDRIVKDYSDLVFEKSFETKHNGTYEMRLEYCPYDGIACLHIDNIHEMYELSGMDTIDVRGYHHRGDECGMVYDESLVKEACSMIDEGFKLIRKVVDDISDAQ